MTPQRHERISDLFLAACELETSAREGFLDRACGSDAELQKEVESLLAQDERDDALSSQATTTFRSSSGSVDSARPRPERIGGYKVLGVLGEGGMGIVYEAEQQSPRRRVALKVIRSDVASRRMLRRFEHEAQVLGRLQHAGIAQIIEAGVARSGGGGPQPFFAMEFVRGQPITGYADEAGLGVRARLELLVSVCEAVEHAHQKGVIHRDLKPANILVDQSGQPKVLDFGVARMTDADVRTTTWQTGAGQLIGTVPYMSPEQVAGDPAELDTRADVYALGVVGYELLSGRLPCDLEKKAIAEAVRIIGEVEPVPLSAIRRSFRGDLDTIISKALAKDKQQRYQSAAALADDLRRYVRNEPILARPLSTFYQLRKLAIRHKSPFILATLLVLVMVAFGGVAAWQAVDIADERDRAVAARVAERQARVRAEQIQRFLEDMLASVNPRTGRHDVTVREVLDASAQRLEPELDGQPAVRAAIHQTIGRSYGSLGLYEQGAAQHVHALRIRRQLHGEDHPDVVESMNDLAALRYYNGQYDQAERLYVDALQLGRRVLGPEHEQVTSIMNNLAVLYRFTNRLPEAETLYFEALEIDRRRLGDEHEEIAVRWNNLGALYFRQGRLAEAEELYRRALGVRQRLLSADHPLIAQSMNNLAAALRGQGQLDEAEGYYRQALEIRRRVLPPSHPDLARSMLGYARLLMTLGKVAEAEALLHEALSIRRETLPAGDWRTASAASLLAECLTQAGRYTEAEDHLLGSYPRLVEVLGPTHAQSLGALERIVRLYEAWGKADQLAKWRAKLTATADGQR